MLSDEQALTDCDDEGKLKITQSNPLTFVLQRNALENYEVYFRKWLQEKYVEDFLKTVYLSGASRMGHWVKTHVAMSDHPNSHLRTHVVKGETAEICLLSSTQDI